MGAGVRGPSSGELVIRGNVRVGPGFATEPGWQACRVSSVPHPQADLPSSVYLEFVKLVFKNISIGIRTGLSLQSQVV